MNVAVDSCEYTFLYENVYWGMSKRGEGSRLIQLGLDKELVDDFTDFREGYLGAPEYRVLAEAIKLLMTDRLAAEPEVKKRYEAARERRRGSKKNVVHLIPGDK